jgi:hypothetical protein
MVRLTKPELDHSYESLDERLVRLERGAVRPASEPSIPAAPALRPIGSTVTAPAPVPAPPAVREQPIATTPARPEPAERPAAAPEVERAPSAGTLTLSEVRERFSDRVVPRTPRSAQLLLRSARVEALEGLLLTIAVPTEEMRQNTELIAPGLKAALEHEFKMILIVQWTVDPTLEVAPTPARRAPARPAVEEEFIDGENQNVADDGVVVDSVASHLITEMFPGAEEIS